MPVKRFRETVFVGVDPGKNGGVALLYSFNEDAIKTHSMPETELDLWNLFNEIKSLGCDIIAVIERVHAMPKNGVVSMFEFGRGYGSLRMALTAIGASWEDVPPQKWMKALNVKKNAEKDQKLKLLQFAQQLYPKLELWKQPKSLGRQKAVCDALLIATYCKRKHTGGLG